MAASVKMSLRHHQCCQTSGERYTLPLSRAQENLLSRSQTFTSNHRITKAEKIHKIKESVLYKIQPREQLGMFWWRCEFHNSLSMNTVSVSRDLDRIIPNAVHRTILPNTNPSSHALMHNLHLFSKSWSPTMYNTFSGFNPFSGPTPTDGSIVFLGRLNAWISTVMQNLTNENIYCGSRQKQYVVMSLASCTDCLQIRLLVRFVAPLTIGSLKNFVFQTLNSPSISKNLMFSQWIRTQI